jgi:hypothetical protein
VDANYQLKEGRLVKAPVTWKKFWREIEVFPATVLKKPSLAWFSHVLFHPVKSYWRLRVWLSSVRKEHLQ